MYMKQIFSILIIGFCTCIFSSCRSNCCSIIPPLRPMPNCEQHQPTGLKMPYKVYHCKWLNYKKKEITSEMLKASDKHFIKSIIEIKE